MRRAGYVISTGRMRQCIWDFSQKTWREEPTWET